MWYVKTHLTSIDKHIPYARQVGRMKMHENRVYSPEDTQSYMISKAKHGGVHGKIGSERNIW